MPPMRNEFGIERIAYVILSHFAGSPAGRVEVTVVERKVDVAEQRRDRAEALEHIGKQIRLGRLGWDFDNLRNLPRIVLTVPKPDRAGKIFERDDDADKSVRVVGIVRGTQLQHHLLLGAQIQCLCVLARAKVPEMQAVTKLTAE